MTTGQGHNYPIRASFEDDASEGLRKLASELKQIDAAADRAGGAIENLARGLGFLSGMAGGIGQITRETQMLAVAAQSAAAGFERLKAATGGGVGSIMTINAPEMPAPEKLAPVSYPFQRMLPAGPNYPLLPPVNYPSQTASDEFTRFFMGQNPAGTSLPYVLPEGVRPSTSRALTTRTSSAIQSYQGPGGVIEAIAQGYNGNGIPVYGPSTIYGYPPNYGAPLLTAGGGSGAGGNGGAGTARPGAANLPPEADADWFRKQQNYANKFWEAQSRGYDFSGTRRHQEFLNEIWQFDMTPDDFMPKKAGGGAGGYKTTLEEISRLRSQYNAFETAAKNGVSKQDIAGYDEFSKRVNDLGLNFEKAGQASNGFHSSFGRHLQYFLTGTLMYMSIGKALQFAGEQTTHWANQLKELDLAAMQFKFTTGQSLSADARSQAFAIGGMTGLPGTEIAGMMPLAYGPGGRTQAGMLQYVQDAATLAMLSQGSLTPDKAMSTLVGIQQVQPGLSTQKINDLIAQTSRVFYQPVGKIAEAAREGGSVAQSGNMSYEEYLTLLGGMAKTGETPSEIATMLAMGTSRYRMPDQAQKLGENGIGVYTDKSRTQYRNFADILIEIKTKMDDGRLSGAQLDDVLQDLFGPRQERRGRTLINMMGDFDQKLQQVKNSTGASKEYMDAWGDTIEGKLSKLTSSWDRLLASIGDTKAIKSFIGALGEGLDAISKFVEAGGKLGFLNTVFTGIDVASGTPATEAVKKALSGEAGRILKDANTPVAFGPHGEPIMAPSGDVARRLKPDLETFGKHAYEASVNPADYFGAEDWKKYGGMVMSPEVSTSYLARYEALAKLKGQSFIQYEDQIPEAIRPYISRAYSEKMIKGARGQEMPDISLLPPEPRTSGGEAPPPSDVLAALKGNPRDYSDYSPTEIAGFGAKSADWVRQIKAAMVTEGKAAGLTDEQINKEVEAYQKSIDKITIAYKDQGGALRLLKGDQAAYIDLFVKAQDKMEKAWNLTKVDFTKQKGGFEGLKERTEYFQNRFENEIPGFLEKYPKEPQYIYDPATKSMVKLDASVLALQYAVEENTKATDRLTGHYNIPGWYTTPGEHWYRSTHPEDKLVGPSWLERSGYSQLGSSNPLVNGLSGGSSNPSPSSVDWFGPFAVPKGGYQTGNVAYEKEILASAKKYGVDPALIAATIKRESSFDPKALGGIGEVGLMQVNPINGGRGGKSTQELWDPATNIDVGTSLLASARDTVVGKLGKESIPDLISAYAQGNGGWEQRGILTKAGGYNVDQWDYIKTTMADMEKYSFLRNGLGGDDKTSGQLSEISQNTAQIGPMIVNAIASLSNILQMATTISRMGSSAPSMADLANAYTGTSVMGNGSIGGQ